jgi:eukaryotic-like serine/threonine-protein kinase
MTEAPSQIGKYRIVGLAGSGAMGTVYVAHDPVVDRKVAIKVAHSIQEHPEHRQRIDRQLFRNEAQAAGGLVHPYIVTIYDAGEIDGQIYLVMEYLEGARTLHSLIPQGGFAPLDRVLNTIAQCAEALEYAHSQGVVHRDIKPANIMLTQQGVPKICDFGIASREDGDLTQVMSTHVTPRYMAPEHARSEPITPQTDLFSLGIVLYELLTGTLPFQGDSVASLVHSLLNTEPKPVSERRPGTSRRIDVLLQRALAKAPADRFASGTEFAEACRQALLDIEQPPPPSAADKLTSLRSLEIFRDFSDADLGQILKAGDWQQHPRGACLIKEGSANDALHIVISGEVSIRAAERELRVAMAGDIFGETEYLTGEKPIGSAVTVHPAAIIRIALPLKRWASLPLQLRMGELFQRALIRHKAELERKLLRLLP